MRCCVCGQELGPDPAVLVYGAEKKYICDQCEGKFEKLFDEACGKQEKLPICEFLHKRAKMSPDKEVRDYLLEMLKDGGYAPESVGDPPPPEGVGGNDGGWIALLRTMAWIEIISGCIASLVLGVVLGQDSPALGVVVTLLGILLFFVINAVFMVFLDLAADVRFIRMHINKKNV